MIDRIQQLIDRLKIDLSRANLGVWLAVINVTVVLLVVAGISFSAIGLLRSLADNQGMASVQLAGAMAREDLRRYGEDALTYAKGIADRQTFQRLLGDQSANMVSPYLARSCVGDTIHACAVFERDALIAQAGAELPWAQIAAAAREQGEHFLAAPEGAPYPILGASTQVGGASERRLYVARFMDEQMAQLLAGRVGMDVRLINYRSFVAQRTGDEFARLHSAALSDGRFAVMRIGSESLYSSSFPIFTSAGEAVALLEARLPTRDLDASVGSLVQRLLVTAIVLGALAVLAGIILGQQIAGPLSTLTDAAVRLGQGDFSTSIPVGGTAEVGKLARTMEDMRSNLVELTGTLRRREAEAQAVLGGVVEGVYAVDRSRVIRYLNPQAARLLGVKPEDALGRFCGDVLKPCAENGHRPCDTRCPIVRARSEGTAQATESLNLSDGAPRTTIITSAAPVDELQVQVIRDETELEGVRRARDSVLVNISHEFRTPLAAQLASIELLREGIDRMPREQQKELVLSLERGTLRLTRLIDNLLESVRIESGQLGIRRKSVALDEIVEDAEALIGALLKQRRQKLEVAIPEDLPRVDGDGPRLTQVFVNLLANASKFAPEDSTVRIGAEAGEGFVQAWVEDEGPGVPHIEGRSIFERFHRGVDEEPEPGGLGLGLWIVKSIVDRHGGTIAARRTAQERTRFEVTLPTQQQDE